MATTSRWTIRNSRFLSSGSAFRYRVTGQVFSVALSQSPYLGGLRTGTLRIYWKAIGIRQGETLKHWERLYSGRPVSVELERAAPCIIEVVSFLGLGRLRAEIWTGLPTPSELPSADASYAVNFGSTNLIDGILLVSHGLGGYPTSISVWDGSGELVSPDGVTYLNGNQLSIDLSSFNVSSGWQVRVEI